MRVWKISVIPVLLAVAACGALDAKAVPATVGRLMTEALYNPDGVAAMAAALPKGERRAVAECLADVHDAASGGFEDVAAIDAEAKSRIAAIVPGAGAENGDYIGARVDSDIAMTAIVAPAEIARNESFALRKEWWSTIDGAQRLIGVSAQEWSARGAIAAMRPMQEDAYARIAAMVCG